MKNFQFTRTERDLMFEALASDRADTAGLLGAASRRTNSETATTWDEMVLANVTERYLMLTDLMARFAVEDEA